ncbi:MAG TPA: BamA/TamA family outer membrane protein, partial [Flavitalea sp.]|nr:BamA/TamA family outer membrane protein [Flavitalea sp.]
IFVNTKKETPVQATKVYQIDDVNIYSNYSLNTTTTDTSISNSILYRGYRVFDSAQLYKPKLFEQAMQFMPGDVYNRREHNLTLNRLINLNIFKFVKNRFEVAETDTMLNAFYYLTPLPKKALRTEIGGNTKSNNITGSNLTLGFTNRNTFRGGEIMSLNATAGFELQYSGQFKGYNTFRLGGEANLAIPRFLVPFVQINPRGGFVPRTNIQLGYEVLTKQKLYTLNSFKGQFGYIWKENIRKEHTFYPISIQYVKPVDVTQEYIDSMINDPTLQKAIDTQFILGANYNYNFNGVLGKVPADGFYFNGILDVSGNIAGLIKGNDKGTDSKNIFGVPFSQYLKTEADFRYYKALSKSNVLANRIIIGAGFPYGNSAELPYIKQFFIGGNNSLRAFRSRSVGPGTYLPDEYGTDGFVAEQSGDIKLEMNSELRFKVVGPVYGALFVDAGNIWLYNENPLKPGSKFSNKFLSELAVGTGLGVRVDINILVLRLDVGIPVRKPFLPEDKRWVVDDIKFHSSDWRKENLIFNLAIGYPF